ncbi:hypothetical protein J3459_003992 [Metarhizium acridum]|uniref:Uncharacterized protein n=1 Tax=Metarhizium acridum (strain CQMa 102) TaxID=655827 RepID=E9DXF8_METAQ|nr:uncharacterized protein MAC_02306 [Metarhizium acridum CQMa 102]EFY91716.1 hypothetical protein MAC_02306 [Metarhizium acridum CQMa 102]KAG8420860.1 hypothetical protein J3458_002784 [Metarhizium acridum]KAG8428359.1 hypothetical protein J3459_003992 [Metarhizium acridum]
MVPQTRASRRRTNASTLHPSVEAAYNHVSTASSGDNLNGNPEPKSTSHEADRHPKAETETEAPQVLVYVRGVEMNVPQTYDPDTYYPDRRMPWTPEPEPYSPETYTAWGRKHFGEEWYKLRQTMIEERNIFLEYDPVYHERQRTLRIIAHKIERRPFEPRSRIFGADWKRLWARLSKEWGIEIVRSPTPQKNSDDSDTDLSGYSTYDPTPEYRTPSPFPEDPWERLEYDRKRFSWNEEEYEFEKIFLKENLIDMTRCRHENEPGDKPAREKRQLMESFRNKDPLRFRIEQDRFQAHIDLRKKGWTTEQIEALYNATVSMHEWIKRNSARSKMRLYLAENLGKPTPEQQAARSSWWDKIRDATIEYYGACPRKGWDSFGFSIYDFLVGVTTTLSYEEKEEEEIWRQNTHARLCSRRQQEALASTKGDAQATEKAPNPSPRQTAKALHGTRSGRITKEAPTHAKASPSDPRRRRPNPEAVGELGNSTRTASQIHKRQPKTYKKERSSRRQAGKAPEYGMLDEGEIPYSLRKPSNTRPTSRSSLRGGKKSKGEREARSVKSRETLKSRKSRRAG